VSGGPTKSAIAPAERLSRERAEPRIGPGITRQALRREYFCKEEAENSIKIAASSLSKYSNPALSTGAGGVGA